MSARVYSRFTVASVPSTETCLVIDAAQAGLIAGTVPTNGSAKFLRNRGSTMVEAVLQAITTRSGRCASISSPNKADDMLDQRRLGESAIGKGRIVGDVEEIGVRPRGGDLAIDREAAEAGIEHQNGLPCRHRATNDTRIWRLQSCRLTGTLRLQGLDQARPVLGIGVRLFLHLRCPPRARPGR